MKKTALINAPLSSVIAELGHTDSVTLCDAGLPIPQHVDRIDLAIIQGLPRFIDVFNAMAEELCIEKIVIAEEMSTISPAFKEQFLAAIQAVEKKQGKPIVIEAIPHATFKQITHESRAIIRTGECTYYANAIIYAGVAF